MHHIQHWELRSASAQRVSVDQGCVLRVSEGRVWITLEQGSEDIWLLPGQAWRAPGRVHLWISADPVAQMQVLTPVLAHELALAPAVGVPAGAAACRRWLRRCAHWVVPPMAAVAR